MAESIWLKAFGRKHLAESIWLKAFGRKHLADRHFVNTNYQIASLSVGQLAK